MCDFDDVFCVYVSFLMLCVLWFVFVGFLDIVSAVFLECLFFVDYVLLGGMIGKAPSDTCFSLTSLWLSIVSFFCGVSVLFC